LIFGTIANDATIVMVLLRKIIDDFHFFQEVSYERIRHLAHRYKQFPQYQVGADLAGTASVAITPLLLAIFFAPDVIGFYAMALMVIRLPSKLVGSAMYQVFYQKACIEKNRNGSIKKIVETIHTRLISLGAFACVIVMILGPELFTFALGTQWATAGVYAQIIAPWMFFAFILIPLTAIFNVLEKQAANLWFSILILVTRIIVIFVGGFYADPILVMVLLSITGIFFWGWVNMYTLKVAGVSVPNAIQEILRYFFLSLTFCLPLIIAKYYLIPTNLLIGITIVTSILYYAVILYKDTQLKQELINILKKYSQK